MRGLAIAGEAWRAIGSNRLRTGLTMLGMIIGVGAVVLMAAVGQGAQTTVNQSINAMGSHLFMIVPGASNAAGVRSAPGTIPSLTLDDAQALAGLPSLSYVVPVLGSNVQLSYGANNWNTRVLGTTPEYLPMRVWDLEAGQPLTADQVRRAERVVLVGQTVALNLFQGENPVGKTLRIKNFPFQVIGLLAAKGQSLDGQDQDDRALVPLTTAQSRLFGNPLPGRIGLIMAQARSAAQMNDAEADIIQRLRSRHRLAASMEDDFMVRNLTAVAETAATTARVLSWVLGTIASVSLLVGGIGIMNIMLVAVTERTREIGLRVAVGARRQDILLQFLLEAIWICAIGGLIGVALGIGAAWLFSVLADMVVVVSLGAGALALSVAVTIGVFFGYYPAHKAASMRPVEALRYE